MLVMPNSHHFFPGILNDQRSNQLNYKAMWLPPPPIKRRVTSGGPFCLIRDRQLSRGR
jgi:hypothetical protein